MRIGIFGGTFDPPHEGHVKAAKASVFGLGLDKLLVIPTAEPPHKNLAAGGADAQSRLEMTRIAFKSVEKCLVSDMEIERGGRSYTVDTLDALKAEYPGADLCLLMGTDMFLSIEGWRDYEKIMSEAVLAPFARAEGDMEGINAFADRLWEKYKARTVPVNIGPIEISSTKIRRALPHRGGFEHLDNEVYKYILSHGLYGARPDLDWLREDVKTHMDLDRIPHMVGCENMAIKLCLKWGGKVGNIREAAIIHDITKHLSLDEQLKLCEKYDIIPDNAEIENPKLLHAITGAALAKALYNSPEEVCEAIRWHTTGKADMSLAEKIVYMADYTEKNRTFEGVKELRMLSSRDLDGAMRMGLEMSLNELRDKGIVPHPRTQQALEWFIEHPEG
ncbi:MAG: nicotinate (nicotinamide) nucleotide adenylyltransferase [Oscillospiraceae bacterium]|nr:nicotinate (nicotinamide) nucleotide adenylyltransferase [Oscillospiraceae bacterium]